jgi:arylsulfatase A-like enzyme
VESSWRETVFGEYYGKQKWRAPMRMVRSHRWKYTRYTRYGEELYDLEKDPAEIHNLADDANFQTVKQKLASQLNDWMSRTDDPFNTLRVTDRLGEQLDKQ